MILTGPALDTLMGETGFINLCLQRPDLLRFIGNGMLDVEDRFITSGPAITAKGAFSFCEIHSRFV